MLFDLDGTLTDPNGDIVAAMTSALDSVGAPVPADAVLRAHIGPPLLHTLGAFGLDPETAAVVMGRYREAYRANRSADTTVHDGMPELLASLRAAGVRIGVATSKPAEIARDVLDETGLAPLVDTIAGPGLDERDASKDLVVAMALAQHDHPDASTVQMVGDRSFDVLGARAHGIDTIGVLWGFGDATELREAGAVAVADTVLTLRGLLVGDPSELTAGTGS
ncbi:MAG TPA: HAD hydrolase-like protein [Acidimicrobiales bacterium]|nr:HAD hydrolase-like protein [Acidimicrobiales bacterium]